MKQRLNKLVYLGLLGFTAALLLASVTACAAEKVTVTWGVVWLAPERTEMVKVYNQKHPEVNVKEEFITTDKLLASIAAGNPPDAAMFDRARVAEWAVKGALYCVDQFAAETGMKGEDYFPVPWNQLFWEGKMYCMPEELDARALYWNKDLFRKAGLDPERPPVTIAELDEYAEKLMQKRRDGSYEMVGFIPWYGEGWNFKAWGRIFGGNWMDPQTGRLTAKDPKLLDALEWMVSYAKKYGTERMVSFYQGWSEAIGDAFYAGTLGMVMQGNWQLGPNHIAKYAPTLDYGVAPFPYPEGGTKNYTLVWGWANIVPTGVAHPREVFDLLKWVAEPEGQMMWCAPKGVVQYFPFNKIAAQDPIFYQGHHKVFMDLVAGDGVDAWEVSPEASLLMTEAGVARDNAIYGRMSAKEALEQLDKRLLEAWEKRVK